MKGWALLGVLAAAISFGVSAKSVVLYVDGEPKWGCPVSDVGGVMYVPAREFAESLGLQLTWLPRSATLIFNRGADAAALRVGGVVCDTGKDVRPLPGAVLSDKGMVIMPVQAAFEMFGMSVSRYDDMLLVLTEADAPPPERDETPVLMQRYATALPLGHTAVMRARMVPADPVAVTIAPATVPTKTTGTSATAPATVDPATLRWNQALGWNGNGLKQTEAFQITNPNWRIRWTNSDSNFIVDLYDATTHHRLDLLANAIGDITDEITYPHEPVGSYYLNITGGDAWSLAIECGF